MQRSASHSGRFIVRIPSAIHRALALEANRRGVSLNRVCNERLACGAGTTVTAGGAGGAPVDRIVVDRIVDASRRLLGDDLEGIVLFGSAVRGEATAASDIDLLLVVGSHREIDRDLYAAWDAEAERAAGADVSPHFVRLPEDADTAGGIWFEAAVEGRLLHDRAGGVEALLRRLRGRMADGALRREWTHGHPYWVRREP